MFAARLYACLGPFFLLLAAPLVADEPDWPSMPFTPHADFQAVDDNGFGTFPLFEPVRMRGVILNDSAAMLDPAPGAPGFLGGLWQTFVQTVDEGDFGGTACWMGQFIGKIVGNHPAGSYTDAEWLVELERLSHDPQTGHLFAPGDLVEIRARAPGLAFRGKTNINEQHSNNPNLDFDIHLITPAWGLPVPTLLSVEDLKDVNDDFIFDPTRQTGCERFQGTLVRFNDVWLTEPAAWAPNADLLITDGTYTFPIKLGLGDGFADFPAPAGEFDIVGILDQEDFIDTDGYRDGYRLWVHQDYDGNPAIVPAAPAFPGDTNCDGSITFADILPFVTAVGGEDAYTQQYPHCRWLNADCDHDQTVTFADINPFVQLLSGS